jgi:PAS domain S-box-containing protein/putative nucleotidyltransferase with HDIG domain
MVLMVDFSTIEAIFEQSGSNIPLLAQSCADAIPELFPQPEQVHALITLNKIRYASPDFHRVSHRVHRKIRVPKKCKGTIQIYFEPDALSDSCSNDEKNAEQVADLIVTRLEQSISALPSTSITLDSEKRYQLLADNAIDVIWIMDPLLNFTYISPSIQQMTGYTVEEWIGTNLAQHATRKEFLSMAGQAIRAMRGLFEADYVTFTANMLRKDGSEVPVEIIGRLLYNQKGFPIGLQGSTRDISERIKAEETLNKSEKQRIRTIEQLYQAGQHIGQSLDLESIYASLHEIISEIMPCDGLIVSSFNPSQKKFMCEALFHEGQVVDVSGFPAVPLEPPGHGTQSQVVHSGKSLYLSDYLTHQAKAETSYYINENGIYQPQAEPTDQDITRSAILVPLKREKQVTGVIQVTSYQLDAFTQENLHFLEAFTPQISAAISNAALYEETQQAQENLMITLQGTIEMLARTVETRDPYTAGHQQRVADLAVALAEQIGLDQEQIEAIHMASIVHDIGKINVPAEILSKPGKLSALEFELIKTHPQVAADLLRGITFPWPIAEIILQHHEKLDGSGYPQGLSGDQIAIEARILIVADIVEAMSSHRPYREALGIEPALAQIQSEKGSKLDAEVVDACLAIFDGGYQLPPIEML